MNAAERQLAHLMEFAPKVISEETHHTIKCPHVAADERCTEHVLHFNLNVNFLICRQCYGEISNSILREAFAGAFKDQAAGSGGVKA